MCAKGINEKERKRLNFAWKVEKVFSCKTEEKVLRWMKSWSERCYNEIVERKVSKRNRSQICKINKQKKITQNCIKWRKWFCLISDLIKIARKVLRVRGILPYGLHLLLACYVMELIVKVSFKTHIPLHQQSLAHLNREQRGWVGTLKRFYCCERKTCFLDKNFRIILHTQKSPKSN